MGLGLFVAMLPIMGLQMPVAVVIAEIIRRLTGIRMSRIAAAAGVWLTNPVTFIPIYAVCYLVGRPFASWLMPDAVMPSLTSVKSMLAEGDVASMAVGAVVALVIGGVVLAVPIVIVGYRLTLSVVERYQDRVAQRQRRRGGAISPQLAPPA